MRVNPTQDHRQRQSNSSCYPLENIPTFLCRAFLLSRDVGYKRQVNIIYNYTQPLHPRSPPTTTTLPNSPPYNKFTLDRTNNFTAMPSKNQSRRAKKIAIRSSSKGLVKKMPAEVSTSTLREKTRPAKASSTSSANPAPAVPGEYRMPAPTCSEDPHFFSGLSYVDALLSSADAPEATHSEIIRPCGRESAHHNRPYHVCLDCRNLAARHITNTIPKLLRTKFLPMCTQCGHKAVQESQVGRSTIQGQMSGCRCAAQWLCCQCRIEVHELANARLVAEVNWRREMSVWRDVKTQVGYVNFNVLTCRCGKNIEQAPTFYRCVGCEEIVTGRVNQ